MNAINNDPIQLLDAGLDQANIQTYDQQQNLDLQVREEHHIEAIKDELDDALTGKTEPETFLSNLSIASTQQNLDIHSAATSTSEVGLNEPTASDKASTFCQIMRHADAPMNFRLQVLSRLIQWRLLDPSADYSEISDNAEFNRIMNEARKNAATAGPEFLAAFQKAPWNFDESIEGIYADDELTTMFPIGVELKSILGDTTRFTFRCEPGSYYLRLIETADGKKRY